MMCRIHIGYRWIHVCKCTPKCILMIVVISNVYTQCTQWGQLWLQWSVCKTDGLYTGHTKGTISQRLPRIRQNAKEALRTRKPAMRDATGKHKGEKPISQLLLGAGSGRGAQKLQTRSISDCRLSFMQLCYDQIATQQNQHLICVVCECFDYVRETTTQTKPTFWFVRLCVCSDCIGSMCLASLRFNVPRFAYVSFHSVADYVWSYPLVPKHSVWQIRSLF